MVLPSRKGEVDGGLDMGSDSGFKVRGFQEAPDEAVESSVERAVDSKDGRLSEQFSN